MPLPDGTLLDIELAQELLQIIRDTRNGYYVDETRILQWIKDFKQNYNKYIQDEMQSHSNRIFKSCIEWIEKRFKIYAP